MLGCESIEFSLPFSLALLPPDTYLVGGAVRDALLHRQRQPIDLDLVVPIDAIALAKEIAGQYRAGFVLLDAERSIARLVFGDITVDFAQQVGGSLLTDLQRRDYRMNAIAYHLNTQQIIDPLEGCADLQQQVVRMVAAENLADDPLRLLRGYRQAAQLGFRVDSATQQTIQELAPRLGQVAAERVLMELRYLLNSSLSHAEHLTATVTRGLLESWLPGMIRATLGDELQAVTTALQLIAHEYPALSQRLHRYLQPTIPITGAGIALWAQVLRPLGNPLQPLLSLLTVSSAESKALTTAIAHWPTIAQLHSTDPVAQYYFFRASGECLPIAIVLSLAAGLPLDQMRHLIDRYLDPYDPISHPVTLVNGSELMTALNLPPSPLIGQLLEAIQLAKIQGEISSKPEAVNYALTILKRLSSRNI